MIVNFIEYGFPLTTAELDYPPDNDDRVVFDNDIYIVEDRVFRIGKNSCLDIYVKCIGSVNVE